MTNHTVNSSSKPIVIYGIGKTANILAHYLLSSGLRVSAFTIEGEFCTESHFKEKPVVNFNDLANLYPPDEFDVMIAIGYQDMNQQRERIFNECKAKGYYLAPYIHPSVTYFSEEQVSEGTIILDHVTIQPAASIGKNTYVWSNSVIAHGSQVMDNCWVAAGSIIAGDAVIGNNTFLGVNSTIGHNTHLGKHTFVGANTLVAKNTADNTAIISAEGEKLRLNSIQFIKFSKL